MELSYDVPDENVNNTLLQITRQNLIEFHLVKNQHVQFNGDRILAPLPSGMVGIKANTLIKGNITPGEECSPQEYEDRKAFCDKLKELLENDGKPDPEESKCSSFCKSKADEPVPLSWNLNAVLCLKTSQYYNYYDYIRITGDTGPGNLLEKLKKILTRYGLDIQLNVFINYFILPDVTGQDSNVVELAIAEAEIWALRRLSEPHADGKHQWTLPVGIEALVYFFNINEAQRYNWGWGQNSPTPDKVGGLNYGRCLLTITAVIKGDLFRIFMEEKGGNLTTPILEFQPINQQLAFASNSPLQQNSPDIWTNIVPVPGSLQNQDTPPPKPKFSRPILNILALLCCTVPGILLWAVCLFIIFAVLSAVSITTIVIGAVFHDESYCPADKNISLLLIVGGTIGLSKDLLETIFKFIWTLKDRKKILSQKRLWGQYEEKEDIGWGMICLGLLIGLLYIGEFCCFIATCVKVYGVYDMVNYEDVNLEKYCHFVLYRYSFWYVTVSLVVCVFLLKMWAANILKYIRLYFSQKIYPE